ncbi:hypothetical protein [Vreelandella glaciei]|uniref:hypothetical protein n=1 Tax=Vreelandella glaciei TaxID=186761 RepID=UPI0030010361
MEKIEQYFDRLFKIFVDRRTTKAFFQASVVLAAAFLIGIKDQGPFLFEKEASAYELKFKIEEREGASLEDINCSELENDVADCRLAKYQMETVGSYISAFMSIMNLIRIFLIVCGAGALASFVMRPAIEDEESEAGS